MANLKVVNAVGERVVTLTGTTVMLFMCFSAVIFIAGQRVEAQPTLLDPKLDVRTVVSGLRNPTSMAFLSDEDILVLEKETGKVQRVWNGQPLGRLPR